MIKVADSFLRRYFRDKTIALIGNSYDKDDNATEIDMHDMVIRCNLAKSRIEKWDYETIKPDVPTGNKIDVMAGFWNHMNVLDIIKDYPEINLLLTVRPETQKRKKYWMETSKMDGVDRRNYIISSENYKCIARKVGGAPVLVGIVALYILHKYNTAKMIDIYNFNFYTPNLNNWNVVQKQVYDKWLHRKGDDIRYGFHEKDRSASHNLTQSYMWFCKCLNANKNMKWKLPDECKKRVKEFLIR